MFRDNFVGIGKMFLMYFVAIGEILVHFSYIRIGT